MAMVETNFEHTDIGLIPEDWEVKSISDVANVFGGGTPSTRNPIFWNGDINWFTPTEVGDTKYLINSSRKITELGLNNSSAKILPVGTILITTRAGIGDLGILKLPSATNQGFQSLIPLENINSEYLYYLASTLKPVLLQNASGSTFLEISPSKVKSIQIPLPPLPEQQAIAEVLGNTDAWIESLEKLIVKKKLIKQGAMQNLLTPKEDWEEITLFEIAEENRNLFNDGDWIESIHIKNYGIRLIQTGNIGVGKFLNKSIKKYINEHSFRELNCKELLEGDLLICRLAEPAGRTCLFPKTEDYKSIASVDVTIYRPDEQKYNRRLLMYLLSTEEWFNKVTEQVGGTTHKRISRTNLGNIKIALPKSQSEQTLIATILSDMDNEIESLKQKLIKAKQIKQGLMQELLTGKIRLV